MVADLKSRSITNAAIAPSTMPARIADVDGWREWAAQERADHRADAIREQDVAEVVLIPGGSRALDVVHALREVVDPQRDRRDQQRPDTGKADQHLAARYRQVQPD